MKAVITITGSIDTHWSVFVVCEDDNANCNELACVQKFIDFNDAESYMNRTKKMLEMFKIEVTFFREYC